MTNLIMRDWNGKKIRHREDGFMSATDMCQSEGRLFADWFRLKTTKEYLKALQDKHYGESHNELIEINQGGNSSEQGTWVDRRVAMRLAQWLSPEFAIQVDEWIVELMTAGTVTIAQPVQPEPRRLAPQRDVLDYLEAAKSIGIDQDPILKSLFSQRIAEQLGKVSGIGEVEALPIVLTVRAQQLGISQKCLGTGSTLGKYIVACGFEPLGKSQHGKYSVNTFTPSPGLDAAIVEFFAECESQEVA